MCFGNPKKLFEGFERLVKTDLFSTPNYKSCDQKTWSEFFREDNKEAITIKRNEAAVCRQTYTDAVTTLETTAEINLENVNNVLKNEPIKYS